MAKPTEITRDIADGEHFTHKGPLRLIGNIGRNAVVTIEDGGLYVKGSVADGTRISVNDKGNGGQTIIRNGGTTVIFSGVAGRVIVNGQDITKQQESILSGLTVDKQIGKNVTLSSTTSITLNGTAGDKLYASADNSFRAQSIGSNSNIRSGNSTHIDLLGSNSTIHAGNSVHVVYAESRTQIHAGNSIHFTTAGPKTRMHAGNSINGGTAHTDASLIAGNKVRAQRSNSIPTAPQYTPVTPPSVSTPAAPKTLATPEPNQPEKPRPVIRPLKKPTADKIKKIFKF
ncbi:MAG: hypothetical protein OXT65_04270 [Alphaproteobacteria bacterium]|nr:hypothetical protein [Alphaproteobacteria bacterium]